MGLVRRLTVRIYKCEDGSLRVRLTDFDAITRTGAGSYEFSGSSSVILEESGSALDALMFTSLAIADGKLPVGQMVLH